MLLPVIMKYKRLALTRSLLVSTFKTQHRGGQLNLKRLIYIHCEQVVQKRGFWMRHKMFPKRNRMFSTSSRRPWSYEFVGALIAHWPTIKYVTIVTLVTGAGLSMLFATRGEWLLLVSMITGLFFYWLVLLQLLFISTDEVNPLTGEKIVVFTNNAYFEHFYERYFRSTKDIVHSGSLLHMKALEILSRIIVKNRDACPHMQSLHGKWRAILYHSSEPEPIFALSSGSIYIPTCLVEELPKEELTFLISHAVASVLLDTQRKKYARTALDDAAMLFIHGFAGFFQYPRDGVISLLLYQVIQSYIDIAPEDQKAVLLADRYALEFTARTCCDIRKIPVYLARLAEKQNETRGRRGLYRIQNAVKSDPTFEKRRENVMSHMGKALEIYSKADCPKLDAENDPIVDYEIAEFERNRQSNKVSRDGL